MEYIYGLIGERIKSEREKAGLTIKCLAELSGISVSFLSYIERKKKKASLDTVARVAGALSIPVAKLFSDDTVVAEEQAGYNCNKSALGEFQRIMRGKSRKEIDVLLQITKLVAKNIKC